MATSQEIENYLSIHLPFAVHRVQVVDQGRVPRLNLRRAGAVVKHSGYDSEVPSYTRTKTDEFVPPERFLQIKLPLRVDVTTIRSELLAAEQRFAAIVGIGATIFLRGTWELSTGNGMHFLTLMVSAAREEERSLWLKLKDWTSHKIRGMLK